jgi:hypothetical protein
MAKRIRDISDDNRPSRINLRRRKAEKKSPKDSIKLTKKPQFYSETPIKKIEDIKGAEPLHFTYIRGNKFRPPRYLGDLLKMASIAFVILIIVNSFNVYATSKRLELEVSDKAEQGYHQLIDAGKSATKIELSAALESFDRALEYFSNAEDQLWFISSDKTFYANNFDAGKAVNALLESGKHFAIAGTYFLEALEEFNKIPVYFVSKNADPEAPQPSITEALKLGLEKTDLAIIEITAASEKISDINEETLPADIALRVAFAKEKIAEVSTSLNDISNHFPAILKLLGDRYPHRYLILFQNNNEIRPSGGFIGSYAILDINDGYIERLTTHDVYDIDGSYGGLIEPPDELKAFTSNWRFRDSNFSPDFPTSAAKARWFLQKEGGATVDTVIALNQGLLQDMLAITGPIQVGEFGALNAENYNLLLSFVIEGKIWGAEDPKHILKVFVPAFKEAIIKSENISKVGTKLYRAIQQKHIMFYSPDTDIQDLFDSLGISGRVREVTDREDYLSIIHSSIGGTKSDQFIEEKIEHHSHIDKNGNIENELTITRTHQWDDDIYLEWKKILTQYGFTTMPDQVIDILGRGRNKVNTRIYVPDDVILLDSKSQKSLEKKFDKALGKNYFFTTTEILAGESSETYLKYLLPFNLNFSGPADSYKLYVDKQPGSRGSIFTKTLSSDEKVLNLASYPPDIRLNPDNSLVYATNLVYDRYFAGLFTR